MSQRTSLAIVGYAYRAPGVGRKGLWEFLESGKSAWSEVPSDRFNHETYYHPDSEKAGFLSAQGGHFLPDDIYAFDPAFFNIKAEEARALDPQIRLLLECAFEAAENAGLTLNELMGANIGVFAASDKSEYYAQTAQDLPTASLFTATGLNPTFFANRLSYFFGLTGPSVAVDAACASSLYAVHLACQSILAGECTAALVGGAKTLNGTNQWIELDTMGTLSPEGKCFSYDVNASGFGRGEGATCLIIKKLSDALACGDPIRSIIANSATNHSGRTQGISMPGRDAQEQLLGRLHQEIFYDPNETTYVEGHGTGTPVGDPIEAGAIASVIAKRRSPSDPLYLGSVKSNLGHLENASGLMSVVKCIMMFENERLLPNANFSEINPKIEGHERLKVLTTSVPWPSSAAKRACISNFGFGGSNSSILLEAAPKLIPKNSTNTTNGINGDKVDGSMTNGNKPNGPQINGARDSTVIANGTTHNIQTNKIDTKGILIPKQRLGTDSSPVGTIPQDQLGNSSHQGSTERLLVFSARSQASLQGYITAFREHLATALWTDHSFDDLAFTLGQRRTHFPYRIAIGTSSFELLREQLRSRPVGADLSSLAQPDLAFIFTGQGAQYPRMAISLRQYSEFADTISAAEQCLLELGAEWLLNEELEKHEGTSEIDNAEISQPACTAVQLALVVLLHSWGIMPTLVLGHSSGEIAAAFAAGIISFRAAIAIAYFRGIAARKVLRNQEVQGAMLAIGTSAEEAERLIANNDRGTAVVAAINSDNSVTISGDVLAIQHIQEEAQKLGLFVRRLRVSVAYHSSHMEQARAAYLASILPYCTQQSAEATDHIPTPSFVSTVSGRVEQPSTIDAHYWARNLCQPVRFLQAVESAFDAAADNNDKVHTPRIALEIGPHSVLQNPTKQILERLTQSNKDATQTHVKYLPSLVRGKNPCTTLLDLAGKLFVLGADIRLEAVNQIRPSHVRVITDLPAYEWNKTARYIHQPRVTAQKLYGGSKYNPLLGWKSPYSEGEEHAFRNVFTIDQLPWLRDHAVMGDIIFPFAGFVSLALEALKSIDSTSFQGMAIRELHVKKPLKIEEDQTIDITTKLRHAETGTQTLSSLVWAFEILSWSERYAWTRHAHGFIEVDATDDALSNSHNVRAALGILNQRNLTPRAPEDEYVRLRDNNSLTYGPSFRNMVALWHAPGIAIHNIALRQLVMDKRGRAQPLPLEVNPPTLDSIFHSLGIVQELGGPRPTLVPSFCLRWRVSRNTATQSGQEFSVVSRCLEQDEKSGNLQMMFIVFAKSNASYIPVAEIGPVRLQCISKADDKDMMQSLPDTFSFNYVPYVNLVPEEYLAAAIKLESPPESELRHCQDLDEVGLYFISRALNEVSEAELAGSPHNIQGWLKWAKATVANKAIMSEADSTSQINKVSAYNATGAFVCKVGSQLSSILRGERQPLEVMVEDGLLYRTYEENVATIRANRGAAAYLEHLANCNVDLNILELGAGTASATIPALEAINRATRGVASQYSYVFTDISAGFFDKARTKLESWADHITYSKLDIGRDPVAQGFDTHSYDVVLASNVLHATPDIIATLGNIHTLLKPTGKLIFMETIDHPPPSFLPFALLPGWWLFEDDFRSTGPLLTMDAWNNALKASGFTGIEGRVDAYPGQAEQLFSALWSSPCINHDESLAPDSIVIHHEACDSNCTTIIKTMSDSLGRNLKSKTMIRGLSEQPDVEQNAFHIFVDSQESSVITNIAPSTFYSLRALLSKSHNLLWVLPNKAHPDAAMIKGLLRSIRLERLDSHLVLLEAPLDDRISATILTLVRHISESPRPAIHREQEYLMVDNVLHVPRLQVVEPSRTVFALEAGVSIKEDQSICRQGRSLEMTIGTVGSPDSIYFRQGDVFATALEDDEVIIRVEAAGINFRDVLTVLGSLTWNPPGLEGAGTVYRMGSKVTDIHLGDRVFYTTNKAGIANFVRTKSLCVCRIPDSLNVFDAASLPIVFSTAITSLIEIGRLRKDEKVLIHNASGAVGQACIMVAKHIGAQIFATAGSEEKRHFVSQTYDIPMSQIFSSRTPEFKDGVLAKTDDQGVDVIVNSLSGNLLQQTWALIAEYGRFVEIGQRDFLENSYLPMKYFQNNVAFHGVDVRRTITSHPEIVRKWLSTILQMLEKGEISPVRPVTQVPISQIKTGLRQLQSGQNIGKIVVTMDSHDTVLAEKLSPLKSSISTSSLLKADATYLITGGTGGIGRALVPWMINRGAKNVIMLGRSATSSPLVKELLQQCVGSNLCVRAIPCDVGSRSDVEHALKALNGLPKVQGIVHTAINLRDAAFQDTEFEDWQQTMASKVQAAWNMHDLFPGLDFFVSLSGMTGIVGNAGQSVYTGTSTFLEAFTQYRIKQDLPAAVIHLPPVEDIGRVAQLKIGQRLKSLIGGVLTGPQVLTLIEGGIIGTSSGLGVGGVNLSWSLVSAAEVEALPWEHFNSLSVMRRRRAGNLKSTDSQQQNSKSKSALKMETPEHIMEALSGKVSSMTAMDRDEITPTRSLVDYGLDSLISLELRNWIRRHFDLEIAVQDINGTKDLQTLVDNFLSKSTKLGES